MSTAKFYVTYPIDIEPQENSKIDNNFMKTFCATKQETIDKSHSAN